MISNALPDGKIPTNYRLITRLMGTFRLLRALDLGYTIFNPTG